MSHPNPHSGLDECFVGRFGSVSVPKVQKLDIKNFSDIPDLIQNLRNLKYGPKIKIGKDSIVTTKYMAGYSGTRSSDSYQYSESIFIACGNKVASHEAIREKMNELKENSLSAGSLFRKLQKNAIEECEASLEGSNRSVREKKKDFVDNLRGSNPKGSAFMAKYMCRSMTSLCRSATGEILDNRIDNFLEIGENECDIEKVLGSRILPIWFIAEAFRHPTMMFYSMLLLHLFVNGQLTQEELDQELHPSEGRTEAALFCSYLIDSENIKDSSCPNNESYIAARAEGYDKVFEEIERKKRRILEKLRIGIYNNLKKLRYPEEKCYIYSKIAFKMCVKKYLEICIGKDRFEKNSVDLDSLYILSIPNSERRRTYANLIGV